MGGAVRAFVALEPPGDVLERIESLLERLRATGADVRWTRPGAVHLTLKFLGPVPPDRIDAIVAALDAATAASPPLVLEARGTGVFPGERRPRIAWVGIEGAGLASLAERIDVAMEGEGFERETRAFHPHLTLGRLRSPRGWKAAARILAATAGESFGTMRAEEVTLFRSHLDPAGARHEALARLPLRGPAAPD